MKLKIIAHSTYKEVEKEVTEFMQTVNVHEIVIKEFYDFQLDTGYTAYHIFYREINK